MHLIIALLMGQHSDFENWVSNPAALRCTTLKATLNATILKEYILSKQKKWKIFFSVILYYYIKVLIMIMSQPDRRYHVKKRWGVIHNIYLCKRFLNKLLYLPYIYLSILFLWNQVYSLKMLPTMFHYHPHWSSLWFFYISG